MIKVECDRDDCTIVVNQFFMLTGIPPIRITKYACHKCERQWKRKQQTFGEAVYDKYGNEHPDCFTHTDDVTEIKETTDARKRT